MKKNPPGNVDVDYFRPKSIPHDYMILGTTKADKRNHLGKAELRQYAIDKYGKLPFIIELHDTPLYGTFFEDNPNVLYGFVYPNLNTKLGKIIQEYEKHSNNGKIFWTANPLKNRPSYHSTTIDFFPTHFNTRTGSFYTLTVKKAENFSRSFIEYLKKKV